MELDLSDLEEQGATDTGEEDEASQVDDILSFMDGMAGTKEARKSANKDRSKRAVEEWNKPVPYVTQTWYVEGLSLRTRRQVCRCGVHQYFSEGTFLKQVTKNGATKWTQASKDELEKFKSLPRSVEVVEEEIDHCISCWEGASK